MGNQFEVEVIGMTCDMCVEHVSKELKTINGVKGVQVDSWKSGKAIVMIEDGKDFSENKAKAAFEKSAYNLGRIKKLSDQNNDRGEEPEGSVDLAIIGTGGAGMAAAIEAQSLGKKVVIIEKGTVGGTCVNVGCIPSKAIIKPANLVYNSLRHGFKGIKLEMNSVNWKELVSQRKELVKSLRKEKYENVLESYPEIKLIQAGAVFKKDEKGFPVLELDNGEKIKAKKYLIATGSKPDMPDIPGLAEVKPLDSTQALFLNEKPDSLIVIGGGFIALELTQAFSRLGVQIESMEVRSRLLSKWDEEISKEVTDILEKEGIPIHKGSVPIRLFSKNGIKGVEMKDKDGNTRKILADEILIATGRVSNTENLNLDEIGVERNGKGGIKVDSFLQTSNPNIYAAGDAANIPKLVYLAAKSGKIAARHAFSQETKGLDIDMIPEVIFSDPQIAQAGITEEEARKKGIDVQVSVLPMNAVPKAIVSYKTKGFIKLVADSNTNILIGAHIISENAGDLIQTAYFAISMGKKYGFTVDDFKDMLFPYLTEVEGLKLAAQTFSMDIKQLSCCAG